MAVVSSTVPLLVLCLLDLTISETGVSESSAIYFSLQFYRFLPYVV